MDAYLLRLPRLLPNALAPAAAPEAVGRGKGKEGGRVLPAFGWSNSWRSNPIRFDDAKARQIWQP